MRFSIGRMMFLMAFVAVNFAIVRFFAAADSFDFLLGPLALGMLPLIDAQAISLYLASARYRLSLRRVAPGERCYTAAFAVLCIPVLAVTPMVLLLATTPVLAFLESAWVMVAERWNPFIESPDLETPLGRYVLVPAIFGLTLSGPPLLLVALLAAIFGRYRIVVTPRKDMP